jgi:hypothetical protein
MAKHPRVEPIRNPTLFEMDKLEAAGRLANTLNVERPYSEPGLLLGTSAFTANGWAGAFYPPGIEAGLLLINARSEKSAKLWTTLETIYLLCASRFSQLVPFQYCWIGIHRALETLGMCLSSGRTLSGSTWKMRKSLWIVLAVLFVAIGAAGVGLLGLLMVMRKP